MTRAQSTIHEGLRRLGIDRLVCAVHDRALPAGPDEDLGCGSPGSHATTELFALLAELGFTGVQLGPPGEITPGNLSPYDGTAFSRARVNVSPRALLDGSHGVALVEHDALDRLLQSLPSRVASNRCDYPRAFLLAATLLESVHVRWDSLDPRSSARVELDRRVARFREQNETWIEGDALHAALAQLYGSEDHTRWGDADGAGARDAALFARDTPPAIRDARLAELRVTHGRAVERRAREQMLLHEQHIAFRSRATRAGLAVFGDLTVGLSLSDRWSRSSLFLDGYALGAPPSRTSPAGQPWGYPVVDPAGYGSLDSPGPALRFLRARVRAVLGDYDGVRIDHPHGLVCPWVYRLDHDDAHEAVRGGARLFSTPDDEAHRTLARYAIMRPGQLATDLPRHSDGWVRELDDAQLERYAIVLDALIDVAKANGCGPAGLVCEVLSTCPYPLERVLARHGLGRFRVTQKADPDDSDDVYRPERAMPADWIMASTHDTPSIWRRTQVWAGTATGHARARWLASHLARDETRRASMLAWITERPGGHALAELAVAFTSRARNVMVFVSDLLGETETYNEPGVVHERNWTLRVPSDFRVLYEARLARGEALDVPAALALALASRPGEERDGDGLIAALIREARTPLPP